MAGSEWWRTAAMYEVYPRSFADGNGDGEGDLAGLLERLPHLVDLGVDGIWIAPWYPSPMADGGYDVSDHLGIDPRFGTLGDADAVIERAHAVGLKVVTDVVPNHTSDRHPWFLAALAAPPGSPERGRYLFRDGRGPDGALPPNNWISAFGGSAWSASGRPTGATDSGTCTASRPSRRTSTGRTRRCSPRSTTRSVLVRPGWRRHPRRRGAGAAKAPGPPDADDGGVLPSATNRWTDNPHWDVDVVHDVFRRWRWIADEYPGDRQFVAEAW